MLSVGLSGCEANYDSESICKQFMSAVVEIQVRDSDDNVVANATGAIISSDGKILTNRHVIRSYDYSNKTYIYYENIFIRYYNEDIYTRVELVKYSNDSDLALLKMEKNDCNYFKINNNVDVVFGEAVYTIGNGNGYGLAYAQGNVAAPSRLVQYEGVIIESIQLSLIINEGNSGGPLINKRGFLVGLTTFRLRDKQNNIVIGTSFALPIKTIYNFLYDL
jgi:S1-C subfamily serine protease